MRLRPLTMLAILGALGACREPAREVPAESLPAGTVVLTPAQRQTARLATDTVRLAQVATPLVVPATLHAPDLSSARVGSIVEGRVDAVRVLPGDRVEAGAPLMLIHSHELATAVRDYSSAEAQLAVAQAAYDRSERLFADEAVPKEEVERRRALVEQARAEFRRAREIVDHLSPSPQGDVTVRAPHAGTVFAVHVKAGEAVTPGTPLVDLGDATVLWATGFVPEHAALTLTRGTPVKVVLDALPGDSLAARVVRMSGTVDSVRRALELRVALERQPAGARPGMFASLVLPGGNAVERAVLPDEAVQRMDAGDVVFVQETPGRYRAIPVRATPLGDGRVAVEGLTPGIVVVTTGAYYVRGALEGPAAGEH